MNDCLNSYDTWSYCRDSVEKKPGICCYKNNWKNFKLRKNGKTLNAQPDKKFGSHNISFNHLYISFYDIFILIQFLKLIDLKGMKITQIKFSYGSKIFLFV